MLRHFVINNVYVCVSLKSN